MVELAAYCLWLTLILHKSYNISTIDPLSELSPYGVRVWDNQNRKRVLLLEVPNILNPLLNNF